jgi:predicted small integral membrane protein
VQVWVMKLGMFESRLVARDSTEVGMGCLPIEPTRADRRIPRLLSFPIFHVPLAWILFGFLFISIFQRPMPN